MVKKEEVGTATKVQSVDRALAILETLAEHQSLSLMDLSEKVHLHKATTHRLVNSLLENGYIDRNPENKQYRISLKMFELGNKRVHNIDFLNVAKSMIRQLSDETRQTVHLVVEDNDEVLYIDKYGESRGSRTESKIGTKSPLYYTAVGKAILATRQNESIKEYWDKIKPEQRTENTITTFERLIKEIEEVRKNGYAIDDEECDIGIFCIGAAFASYKHIAAGAISISLPLSEKPNKDFYIEKVMEYATKISQLLGHF
ncbi:transcription regulator iclr n-terminal [Trichococcus palustris]|uniref:Glycerol operon regulatory protein n=1 Tax=Trichococcus palustris TaxID=140314 RepID=A0A143YLM2_9LACT|nr:IclR family transcriptional regulator [Trichococcus palustris]CZQ92927.1 transcription regulator iclr n-terminal [Trichococcus palustris]SFK85396.1 transcriptional regulator, IclR family [Trichococcus palustris]